MTVRHLLSGATLAAAATLIFAGGAQAQTPLTSGNFVVAPIDPIASLTAGSTFLSQLTAAFNATNGTGGNAQTISGTLVSSVYRNSGNTLDFFYQVITNGTSNSNLTAFSVTSFAGTTTSVAQTAQDVDGAGALTTGSVASSIISKEGTGEGLTFSFFNGVGASSSSYTQFVRTTATSFTNQGAAAVLANGVSANLNANVIAATPPSQAPEPGSLALAATGLMGAMGMVVRRRRSAK